jgi:hypothetical protein
MKKSPFKADPVTTQAAIQLGAPATGALISAGVSILGGLFGRKKRRREKRQALAEMKQMKSEYMNLDFSNPYANLENPYEDLTVNLKQAEFMAERQNQQQANTQAVYNQKVKKKQQAAASIGLQESRNQALSAKGEMAIQSAERKGELIRQKQEQQRTETLYAMAMNRSAAAIQASNNVTKSIIGGIGGSFASFAGTEAGAEAIGKIFNP